jgi:hypothetical protein
VLRCRIEPYWIKATALRAVAPGRARAGRAGLAAGPAAARRAPVGQALPEKSAVVPAWRLWMQPMLF